VLATRKVETKADIKRAKDEYLKKLIAWLYNLISLTFSTLRKIEDFKFMEKLGIYRMGLINNH
jgi:hypothetical protein